MPQTDPKTVKAELKKALLYLRKEYSRGGKAH